MIQVVEDFGFYIQLVLACICWVFIGIYVYERLNRKK